jgi:hypothetical protein
MAKLNRLPLQVSPQFKKRLDDIQKKIMLSKGEHKSLREITDNIVSSPIFREIEENLINNIDLNNDIRIRMDFRRIK